MLIFGQNRTDFPVCLFAESLIESLLNQMQILSVFVNIPLIFYDTSKIGRFVSVFDHHFQPKILVVGCRFYL